MEQKQAVNEALYHICEVKAALSLLVDSRKKSLARTKLDECELWLKDLKEDIEHADPTD